MIHFIRKFPANSNLWISCISETPCQREFFRRSLNGRNVRLKALNADILSVLLLRTALAKLKYYRLNFSPLISEHKIQKKESFVRSLGQYRNLNGILSEYWNLNLISKFLWFTRYFFIHRYSYHVYPPKSLLFLLSVFLINLQNQFALLLV